MRLRAVDAAARPTCSGQPGASVLGRRWHVACLYPSCLCASASSSNWIIARNQACKHATINAGYLSIRELAYTYLNRFHPGPCVVSSGMGSDDRRRRLQIADDDYYYDDQTAMSDVAACVRVGGGRHFCFSVYICCNSTLHFRAVARYYCRRQSGPIVIQFWF